MTYDRPTPDPTELWRDVMSAILKDARRDIGDQWPLFVFELISTLAHERARAWVKEQEAA